MKHQLLALPFSLALAAVPASAQINPQEVFPYRAPDTIPWSDTLPVASQGLFKLAASGDLDNDGSQELIIHSDRTLVAMFSPHAFHSLVEDPLSGVIHDLAVLPSGLTGKGDWVASVGPLGLRVHMLNTMTMTFRMPIAIDSVLWAGVLEVRVIKAGGGYTIYGLASDGVTIHAIQYVPGGGFTPQASIVSTETVHSFEPLEFNGLGQVELALDTDSGLKVINLAGQQIAGLARTGDLGGLAVYPDPAIPAAQRIAYVMGNATGTEYHLYLVGAGHSEGPHTLAFSVDAGAPVPIAFGGISSGDVDGDGDADLAVLDEDSHRAILLFQDCGGPGCAQTFEIATDGFSYVETDEVPALPGTANFSRANLYDLDKDGRPEFVYPMTDNFEILMSDLETETATQEDGSTVGGIFNDVKFDVLTGDIQLVLETPSLHFAPTEIQIVFWSQPDPFMTPGAYVDPHRLANWVFTMHQEHNDLQQVAFPIRGLGEVGSTERYCFDDIDAEHYYIEIRYVTMHGPEIDETSKSYVSGFLSCEDALAQIDTSYLESLHNPYPIFDLTVDTPADGPTWTVGAFTPLVRTPHFPHHQMPNRGQVSDIGDATVPD